MQLMLSEMISRAPTLSRSSFTSASAALEELAIKYVGSNIASTLVRVQAVSEVISAVKSETVQTIAGLLERGENLQALAGSAEMLDSQSRDFRKGAQRVQRQKWRDTFHTYTICVVIALLIGVVLFWALFM